MKRACVFLSATLIGLTLTSSSAQSPKNNVMFIVDFSGSMNEQSDGERKIDAAKKAFRETMEQLDQSTQIGLMVFGQTRPGKHCDDITVLSRLGERSPKQLARSIEDLNAQGWTPIADSLLKTRPMFAGLKGDNNSIVLITDGREECDGDVCSAAEKLKELGIGVRIHIVGLGHSDEDRKKVECAATATGGKYVSATNAKTLKEAIDVVTGDPGSCTVKQPPSDMREWIRAGAIRIEVKEAVHQAPSTLRIPIVVQNCSGSGFGLAIRREDTKLVSCHADFYDVPGLRLTDAGPSLKPQDQGRFLQWFPSDEQRPGDLLFSSFDWERCKQQIGGTVSVVIGLIISDEKKVQTLEYSIRNISLK